jgi:hypothetical protein
VLSEKCGLENKKINAKDDINSNENADILFGEFQEILSLDKGLGDSQNSNEQNCSTSPPGILTV